MKMTHLRISLFIIVFIFVLILPWWLSAIILLGLTIYFPFYFEVLFFGFLFDTLYSTRYNFPDIGLSLATATLLAILFIRSFVRT